MCTTTLIAANNPLEEIPRDDYGFGVEDLARDWQHLTLHEDTEISTWGKNKLEAERRLFTLKHVYIVNCACCGCELLDPLDPIWEDDLSTWLRKELMEMCDFHQVKTPQPEWEVELLREERNKRHSRRRFGAFLTTVLKDNTSVEVFGASPGDHSAPEHCIPDRKLLTLEEMGIEGVTEGVMATVIRDGENG